MKTAFCLFVAWMSGLCACNVALKSDGGQVEQDGAGMPPDDGGVRSDGGVAGEDAAGTDAGPLAEEKAMCEQVCKRLDAAGCEHSIEGCTWDCWQGLGAVPQDCMDEMSALLECASTAPIDCENSKGSPLIGCDAEMAALDQCANQSPDTGVVGKDGGGACPEQEPLVSPPGPPVTSRDATGAGPCAGTTLGEVIDAIHDAHPELSDISEVFGSKPYQSDGSFVIAYSLPDGGFAAVFKRGGGDCPAGCTENEYWYFETGDTCSVVQSGHYHPTWQSDCLAVDGAPMWATPWPPDPADVCGGVPPPVEDISGTYEVCANGQFVACTEKAGDEPAQSISTRLTLAVKQDPVDLSKGTVVVTGTGVQWIDGMEIEAEFEMRRFTAEKRFSKATSSCVEEWSVSVSYDFDGRKIPGEIGWFEFRDLNCGDGGGGNPYCKGHGDATIVVR